MEKDPTITSLDNLISSVDVHQYVGHLIDDFSICGRDFMDDPEELNGTGEIISASR